MKADMNSELGLGAGVADDADAEMGTDMAAEAGGGAAVARGTGSEMSGVPGLEVGMRAREVGTREGGERGGGRGGATEAGTHPDTGGGEAGVELDLAMVRLKPRSDSVLEGLSTELRTEMEEWLEVDNLSYTEVQRRLGERGVVTSRTALCRYYQKWIAPRRYAASVGLAEEICARPEGKIGEALRRVAEQQAFEALVAPAPDVKRARALLQIVAVLERRRVADARLKLEERRVVVRERMEAAANPEPELITDEGKARLLRELFAM